MRLQKAMDVGVSESAQLPVSERESPKTNIAGISHIATTLCTPPIQRNFISIIANSSTLTLIEFFISKTQNQGDEDSKDKNHLQFIHCDIVLIEHGNNKKNSWIYLYGGYIK